MYTGSPYSPVGAFCKRPPINAPAGRFAQSPILQSGYDTFEVYDYGFGHFVEGFPLVYVSLVALSASGSSMVETANFRDAAQLATARLHYPLCQCSIFQVLFDEGPPKSCTVRD
ncbi:hypothetical protein EVAR_53472_1 [Eumeta japonica]|uniref:Uncharacterized protein n=1 Tax=Eumeta variegata TaxID=151549 RepID=A0A4C1XRQ5_EUMVA|nr:hypothetical protein EVAR_53472_1 [Eumeta japonica]